MNESTPLAAPWKRVAASATDALLIFTLHIIVWFISILLWPDGNEAFEKYFLILSPVLSWLYVWIGWATGATCGKWLFQICIVAEDGTRPGVWRAAVRCIGYVVACLPLRAGLLPILYHPKRRGWHDSLARTLVIKQGRSSVHLVARATGEQTSQTNPLLLDFAVPRNGWPFVLLFYCILSALLTYPVISQLSSHIAGDGADGSQFLWNYWFFSQAVSEGTTPLRTSLLFYPDGAPLLFHTMNWLHCVMALPLIQFMDLVTTYNLLLLLSFVLNAFAMYWLCAAWTKHRAASLIAALPFGFSPYFWGHGLGHMNLTAAYGLPLFVAFSYAALTTTRRRYTILAGVSIAICGYCDFQYALFAVLWLGCLIWAIRFVHGRSTARLKRDFKQGALIVGMGGVLLAPILLPAVYELSNFSYMNKSSQASAFKADLSDFFALNPFHFLIRNGDNYTNDRNVENLISPGTVTWLIVIVAAIFTLHKQKLWLLCGAVFLVLACGPVLRLKGHAPMPNLATVALGGVPGNGFNLPHQMQPTIQFARNVVNTPQRALSRNYDIMLPMAWLPKVLPILKPFRVPARLATGVLIAVCVIAASSLAWMHNAIREHRGKSASQAFLLAAGMLMIFEACPVPYITTLSQVHPFYKRLQKDKEDYAIVEAPFAVSPESMRLQTVHGKAIFLGNLARAPKSAFRIPATNALLQELAPTRFQWDNNSMNYKREAQSLEEGLKELRILKTRYIIVHKTDSGESLVKYQNLLEQRLRLPKIIDDATLIVYRL